MLCFDGKFEESWKTEKTRFENSGGGKVGRVYNYLWGTIALDRKIVNHCLIIDTFIIHLFDHSQRIFQCISSEFVFLNNF